MVFMLIYLISYNYLNKNMEKVRSTKQIVQLVIEEANKNYKFFDSQPINQLLNIKFALEIEALKSKDADKKAELLFYAQQAQEIYNHKQNKAKERIERIGLIQQIKQGANDISPTQKIVMAIVILLTSLLAYFQNSQRE